MYGFSCFTFYFFVFWNQLFVLSVSSDAAYVTHHWILFTPPPPLPLQKAEPTTFDISADGQFVGLAGWAVFIHINVCHFAHTPRLPLITPHCNPLYIILTILICNPYIRRRHILYIIIYIGKITNIHLALTCPHGEWTYTLYHILKLCTDIPYIPNTAYSISDIHTYNYI